MKITQKPNHQYKALLKCNVCAQLMDLLLVDWEKNPKQCSCQGNEQKHKQTDYTEDQTINRDNETSENSETKAAAKCDHCGANFIKNQKIQRFCTVKCTKDYHQNKRKAPAAEQHKQGGHSYGEGECSFCGKHFVKSSKAHRFCCSNCKSNYHIS
jgi:hypothetical protein